MMLATDGSVKKIACLISIIVPFVGQAVRADALFVNPASTLPLFRFHTGGVSNNKPEISKELPRYGGVVTPWTVVQWRQPIPLSAHDLVSGPLDAFRVGSETPTHVFASNDDTLSLSIFRNGKTFPINLHQSDGRLVAGGGSNLFLSSDAATVADFGSKLTYSVEVGVTAALIRYDTATAKKTGAVLGGAFSGFRLQMIPPGGKPTISAFIQIQHFSSREKPADHRGCHRRQDADATPQIVYSRSLPGEKFLPFKNGNGATYHFNYVLNDYLMDMISVAVPCSGGGVESAEYQWPKEAQDPRNWKLTSMFIGLESENSDERPQAKISGPQGHVEVGLLIKDLRVERR